MSVGKTKDGRYYCQYYIGKKPKRDFFGRGIEGSKNAEQKNEELKNQGIISGYKKRGKQADSLIFATLAMEYMKIKAPADLTPSSAKNMGIKLGKIIIPAMGHLKVGSISQRTLDSFVKTRLETPVQVQTGPKISPTYKNLKNPDGTIRYVKRTTVNRELCDIQAILNWALARQYIIANPVVGYRKPKKDNAILKPPTLNETRAILAESAPHLIRALKISFFTGLRPGATELFRLTWDDVDLDENKIFILSAKKNGIPYRSVPLHPDLIQDLTRWKKEDKNNESPHLITWKDKPIKRIKKAFYGAKKRAGITRRIRLYDFRHAAITNMLLSGSDLKSVSEIAGHSRTDTTTKIYQHTNKILHKTAIDSIPSLDKIQPDDKIIDFDKMKKKDTKNADSDIKNSLGH